MNVLSWNCQGLGNPWTVRGLKGLESLIHPSLIFLSETKCTVSEIVDVRVELGWRNAFVVPCKIRNKRGGKGVSRSGGLCLMWKDDVHVSLRSYSDNHIDVVVGSASNPKRWRFTGVYGFPKTEDRHLSRVIHQSPNKSDHLPILLEVVEMGWSFCEGDNPFLVVCGKIKETRRALQEWSDAKFGSLREDISILRDKLSVFYEPTFSTPPDEVRVQLEKELDELLKKEQDFWRQRAKVFWLQEGDLNTRFFHQRASNRRKKNRVKGLFNDNGVWCTNDGEIEQIVLGYFQSLFNSSQPQGIHEVASSLPPCITDEMNVCLSREITVDEVYMALKQMHPAKAPGPDGFAPCFYQHFWKLVGNDVTKAICCFMESDDLLRSVNHTNVTLIPKVKAPEFIHQLRPISLCNVIYKLGSKVLANRVKPLLKSIISPFQSAFVPGRLISDNSLAAFEISHFLKKRRRGHVGFGALKLDMSKAYDRVEWSFLQSVLLQLGFSVVWVNWVMRCVRTVSYSFVINGVPRGRVIPERGLRQGDSISPYLFLVCAEALSKMILRAEEDQRIHGVRLCTGAPSISHLFFADDAFIFFKAELEECLVFKEIFDKYEKASGQAINYQKSCISFSKNVRRDKQNGLADVRKKTQGWREKYLSATGKEIMIKAVTQSIPTYVMSCFELPKHLCFEMHRLMARFWWGDKVNEKKIHWLAWEKLCVPKSEGGLGFRNMVHFNQALLAKQGWRLLQNPDSLLARLYKSRYYPNCDFLDAQLSNGASYAWRSIMFGKELLHKGVRYQVGDGTRISVWEDPWLPLPYSFKPFSPPMEGLETLKVADLIDEHEWVVPFLDEIFTPLEVSLIAQIPLSIRGAVDRVVWHYDKKGVYSVRNGYHIARMEEGKSDQRSTSVGTVGTKGKYWKLIWNSKVPPKDRVFMWRLMKEILPTRGLLAKRIYLPDSCCVFCHKELEIGMHFFRDCDVVAWFWVFTSLGLKARNVLASSLEEWIMNVVDILNDGQRCAFFMALWVIWSERNNIVWKGSVFNAACAAQWAQKYLEHYQSLHNHGKTTCRRKLAKWENPPSGRLKVNVDGSFCADHGDGGVGVVIRDEYGTCLAAFARHFPHVSSALHMEAEAARAGILLAIHQDFSAFDLECDCSIVVNALKHGMEDRSDIGRIIEDCKSYLTSLHSVQIRHIFREANGVANRLAHLASMNYLDDVWLDESPAIIQDVLYEDSCTIARGQGYMSPSMHISIIN
ncbi:uncharacterized protein LOC133716838 [Rosa rugosa]|uniref:uncharacterized protein LOC133716838 n=1 Tax=Rosa rugosa TaxID=74645 RepID=UPI002B407DCE|nr:uncharacterized protein LOC133716838 [Rosa rugosa]